MNKLTKRSISIFMALCVALSGTVCHAGKGKGKKQKGKRPASAATPVASAVTMSPEKQQIITLRNKVGSLLSYHQPLSSLDEHLNDYTGERGVINCITEFSEFLVIFLKRKVTDEDLYNGMILFLSIVKHLPNIDTSRRQETVPSRNFYCHLALATLTMCELCYDGIYDSWYKLLEPHTTLGFREFKKECWNPKEKKQWCEVLRTSGGNPATRAEAISLTRRMLGRFDKDPSYSAFLQLTSNIFNSEVGDIHLAASRAFREMHKHFSSETVEAADKAVKALCVEVPKFVDTLHLNSTTRDAFLKPLSYRQEEIIEAQLIIQCKSDYEALKERMGTMNQDPSPASIESAKEAYEKFVKTVSTYQEYQVRLKQEPDKEINTVLAEYAEEIEYCVIRQCRNAADACIKALSESYSEDTLTAAKDAQEKYNQALSKFPKDAIKYEAEFLELKKHFTGNQQEILDLQKKHKEKLDAEALDRKAEEFEDRQRKKAEAWKAEVDKRRQEKDARSTESGSPTIPKKSETFKIVFLHSPTNITPLNFLDEDTRYMQKWSDWYKKAQKGAAEGAPMKLNSFIPIYKNKDKDKFNLDIEMPNGQQVIYEYRGITEGETGGFRIVWYRKQSSNEIVVLYVGKPFGTSHREPWSTLEINSNWKFDEVDEKGNIVIKMTIPTKVPSPTHP